MDLTSTFKNEIFRPVVTILIPGFVATAPFLILAAYTFGVQPMPFVDQRPVPSAILIILVALAAGFVLENIGGLYECFFLDWLFKKRDPDFENKWHAYLRLNVKDEIVGQRYLHTIHLRFKFECSMAPALLLLAGGTAWLNAGKAFWSWYPAFTVALAVDLVLTFYFWYEAYRSAKVLHEARTVLVSVPASGAVVTPAEAASN